MYGSTLFFNNKRFYKRKNVCTQDAYLFLCMMQYNILRLEISVYYSLPMEVFHSGGNVSDQTPNVILLQAYTILWLVEYLKRQQQQKSQFLASTVAFNSMWISLCLEMLITSHLDNAENSCIYQFTKNTLLAIHLLMWQIQIFCWIKISLFLTLSPWEIIAERHEGSFKQITWNLNFCIFFKDK